MATNVISTLQNYEQLVESRKINSFSVYILDEKPDGAKPTNEVALVQGAGVTSLTKRLLFRSKLH